MKLPKTKGMKEVIRFFFQLDILKKNRFGTYQRHEIAFKVLREMGVLQVNAQRIKELVLENGKITSFDEPLPITEMPVEWQWVLSDYELSTIIPVTNISEPQNNQSTVILNEITPMKKTARKQEIVRLCVLLTALDYEVTLENTYGNNGLSTRTLQYIDLIFEEEEVRSMTYEKLYFFFTNKDYTPYSESDDLDNWLKANIRNLYEAQNPQIFKEYDSISLAVHINKYKCIYWTSQQYQLIRLGRRIKFLRVQKGLRQNELGIHTSMVSQIENGLFNPTTSTLNKIALALGTNLTLK
jgi:hypothetical protein